MTEFEQSLQKFLTLRTSELEEHIENQKNVKPEGSTAHFEEYNQFVLMSRIEILEKQLANE